MRQDKPEHGRETLKFFDWAFKNGEQAAQSLDYITPSQFRRYRNSLAMARQNKGCGRETACRVTLASECMRGEFSA
jgi:hypothetical protein